MKNDFERGAVTLDRLDKSILEVLQRDNKIPQRKIAEMVNLSAPAVQRRIKRLEDTGVIQANIAVVDPAKIGPSITLFVQVEMESERTDLCESAKRSFTKAGPLGFRCQLLGVGNKHTVLRLGNGRSS